MATAEFGQAVRRWRDRVAPEAAGLRSGGHRRASGLRREELALLAGISVDYVTRLEQGRATNPSLQVVEALARALRLSGPERVHLLSLAGLVAPGPGTVPSQLTPGVHRLLDRLTGIPVGVYDAAWTLLLANPPYAALMGDPCDWHGYERNGVWRNFLGPGSRVRHTPGSRLDLQTAMAADLRATAGRYPNDDHLRGLVRELRAKSPLFAELWESGTVNRHEAGHKVVDHPDVGPVTLDCDVMSVARSDLRLMIYTAEPGTEDAQRLTTLIRQSAPTPVG
ncbi:helix-turn-helix transcriptional regulator [Pseudonocardia spinosispora]|uniref:helix-turn-helix transcriptional regulator n=1 Tax=Pseudonocardia spinosispora TaxID=103441 RepID=UPI0003FA2513|nr:helix-turn-helix transcriptional regulator [Pseudonocardia spinosispora]